MRIDYQPDSTVSTLAALAKANPAWIWYAIADSAQNPALPDALLEQGDGAVRCLLGATQGSPLAHKAPHLVQLAAPMHGAPSWQWIAQMAPRQPCVTVLASQLPHDALFVQLQQLTEIRLPDGTDMFFAFWDPAILGTLLGQADDATLYVAGPVFDAAQRRLLCGGLDGWWYWDRDGALHGVAVEPDLPATRLSHPLPLAQEQVDALVEASVPDHVLYFVELNQPHLLADVPLEERYGVVRRAVAGAREIGLETMGDLVNYVCAALIYGARWQQDQAIGELLARVKGGELHFVDAMEMLP